jgi:hypothetical protein
MVEHGRRSSHQPCAEPYCGELDTAYLRGSDDVSGNADDKQVAQALVEDDFCRHPRVGTSEDNGERLLTCRQLAAARLTRQRAAPSPRYETTVTLSKAFERFSRRDHRRDTASSLTLCVTCFLRPSQQHENWKFIRSAPFAAWLSKAGEVPCSEQRRPACPCGTTRPSIRHPINVRLRVTQTRPVPLHVALPGKTGGVPDIHFTPGTPPSILGGLAIHF